MTIPESQLGAWSHQGAITASSLTYTSIINCLEQYDFPENTKYAHYLQGSYRNSTNIFGDSDASIVIELESSGRPNTEKLSKEEKKYLIVNITMSPITGKIFEMMFY